MKMKHTLLPVIAANVLLAAPLFAGAVGLTGSPIFAGTAGGGLIPAVTAIVNVFLILAGIVAAVYMVLGGVQYITSAGDEDKASTAKNTILFAVIGLVVIGLAAAITNFVVSAVGGNI